MNHFNHTPQAKELRTSSPGLNTDPHDLTLPPAPPERLESPLPLRALEEARQDVEPDRGAITAEIERSTDPVRLAELLTKHGADGRLAFAIIDRMHAFGDSRCLPALESYVTRWGHDPGHSHVGTAAACFSLKLLRTGSVEPAAVESLLVRLSKSPVMNTAKYVLCELAQEGHPQTLAQLAALANDTSAPLELRVFAASNAPHSALPILETMLALPELKPKIEADIRRILAQVDTRHRQQLLELIRDPDTPSERRAELLYSGIRIPGLVTREILMETFRSPDQFVQFIATAALCKAEPAVIREALTRGAVPSERQDQLLFALAEAGDPADRERFSALLTTPGENGRETAFRYFARVDPAVAESYAREELQGSPARPSPGAVAVLAAVGKPEYEQLLLTEGAKLDAHVNLESLLTALHSRGDIKTLHALAERTPDPTYRREVLRTLAALGDPSAVRELCSDAARGSVRTADLLALMKSGASSALSALHEEFSNSRSRHRYSITPTLESPETFTRLVQSLAASGAPQLTAWADTLIAAKAFGIEHPFRFTPEDLAHIVHTRRSIAPTAAGERQALVVVPLSDHNGAFNGLAAQIRSLREAGFRVVLFEVKNEEEVISSLKSHARFGASDVVILAAHGSREVMSFGGVDPREGVKEDESRTIDLSDRPELMSQDVQGALKEGGRIILYSCSTGEGGNSAPNIANLMREVFPQAAPKGISAPSRVMLSGYSLRFSESGLPVQPDNPWLEFYFAQTGPFSGAEHTLI